MTKFHEGDLVAFDVPAGRGIGWVMNPQKKECEVEVEALHWTDDPEILQEKEKHFIFTEIMYCSIHHLPQEDWSDALRLKFVNRAIRRNPEMEGLSPEEKERLVRTIDTLCAHGVWYGFRWKGFYCYGGSNLYACDWNMTRRCYERCLALKADNRVANSLGYIYYYGRCSQGVPDYEKAYFYFSMAAMDGNHESLYKVGDMFVKGLGVPKNEKFADHLYERVYEETLRSVMCGNNRNNYADAALRMAGSYERRAFPRETIYRKYLEADLGLKIRAKLGFYGDKTVQKTVDAGLEKYKPEKELSVCNVDTPSFVSELTEENLIANRMHVTLTRRGDELAIRFEEHDLVTREMSDNAFFLLTIPELSYCGFVRSYSFSCKGTCGNLKKGESVTYEGVGLECEKGKMRILFYRKDPVTVNSDCWTLQRPSKEDEFTPHWEE